MDLVQELQSFLNESKDPFLAYSSITTKGEQAFRDAFAFYLHSKYESELMITREFSNGEIKRVDIAALNLKGEVQYLVEFKACYAFDLVNHEGAEKIKKDVLSDVKKHAGMKRDCYFVLVSTRVAAAPERRYEVAFKYSKGIARAARDHSFEEQKRRSFDAVKRMDDLCPMGSGTKQFVVFGVTVALDFFVFSQ